MNAPELQKRIDEWHNAMKLTERFSLDKTAPEHIPELWDRLADGFDDGMGGDIARVESTLEILSRAGALDENTVAIDIGCGTGTFTLELAKHCRAVYALDISPKMLAALAVKAEKRGITNIVRIHGDWKNLDLSAFDPEINLALSCLNTGINDFESLDKMNKVSKGWNCYITVSGHTHHTSRNDLEEIVFGRTLNTAFGNDIIFPFNVIYSMGCKPELNYVPCVWNRSLSKPEAVAGLVDDYSRYKDIDDATRRKIEEYVDAKLNEDGMYFQSTNATLGVMTWRAAQMGKHVVKGHPA
jgi:SAM-dependent methyltransferase